MTEIKLLLFLERSLPIGTYRVTLESAQCSQIHANIMLDDVGGLRLCFCMPFSFSPVTAYTFLLELFCIIYPLL